MVTLEKIRKDMKDFLAVDNQLQFVEVMADSIIQDNAIASAIAIQASRATPMPSIPEMSEVWGPIDAALQLSVTGKQDVKSALQGATDHIHNQIEAFRSGM